MTMLKIEGWMTCMWIYHPSSNAGFFSIICSHGSPVWSRTVNAWLLSISLLTGVSNAEARQPGKSPHFSLNWVVGNADLEIINATTGKRSCGGSSRLCKHTFSARWARLFGMVGPICPFWGRAGCLRLDLGWKLGHHLVRGGGKTRHKK
jgi:hypothetical protein